MTDFVVDEGQLLFSLADWQAAAENLSQAVGDFVTSDSKSVLRELVSNISSSLSSQVTGRVCVESSRPLVTKPTRDYEPGTRQGSYVAQAHISFQWEISPYHLGKSGKKRPSKYFRTAGCIKNEVVVMGRRAAASTDNEVELGRWSFELGASGAPGCFFHVGMCGIDERCPFPKGLSIPRLPSVIVTPFDVVDFVLGEMFQDKWKMKIEQSKDCNRRIWSLQRKNLERILGWKKDMVSNSSASPWWNLKQSFPSAHLFIDENSQ